MCRICWSTDDAKADFQLALDTDNTKGVTKVTLPRLKQKIYKVSSFFIREICAVPMMLTAKEFQTRVPLSVL